jgi:hypothetical protein
MPIKRVMGSPDIDQLVAEILADLHIGGEPLPVETAVQAAKHSVFLADRVVSLAAIQDISTSVDELVVTPKTVITPSARDEIRKRRLAVATRFAPTSISSQTAGVSLRLFSTPDSAFSARLEKFGTMAPKLPLPEALDSIEKCLSEARQLCVLLTGRSASAMYEASRRNGIRPVMGIDVHQTADDVNEINANLLILSSKMLTESKIAAILKYKWQTANV